MLARFFKHTRRQPKHVRDRYALGLASGFMSIIVLMWLILPGSSSNDAEKQTEDGYRPFATLFEAIGGQFATARDGIRSSNDEFSEKVEEELKKESEASQNASSGEKNRDASSIRLTPEEIAEINSENQSTKSLGFGGSSTDSGSNTGRKTVLIATTSSQVATSGADTNEE
jgi:hypothetical protein